MQNLTTISLNEGGHISSFQIQICLNLLLPVVNSILFPGDLDQTRRDIDLFDKWPHLQPERKDTLLLNPHDNFGKLRQMYPLFKKLNKRKRYRTIGFARFN